MAGLDDDWEDGPTLKDEGDVMTQAGLEVIMPEYFDEGRYPVQCCKTPADLAPDDAFLRYQPQFPYRVGPAIGLKTARSMDHVRIQHVSEVLRDERASLLVPVQLALDPLDNLDRDTITVGFGSGLDISQRPFPRQLFRATVGGREYWFQYGVDGRLWNRTHEVLLWPTDQVEEGSFVEHPRPQFAVLDPEHPSTDLVDVIGEHVDLSALYALIVGDRADEVEEVSFPTFGYQNKMARVGYRDGSFEWVYCPYQRFEEQAGRWWMRDHDESLRAELEKRDRDRHQVLAQQLEPATIRGGEQIICSLHSPAFLSGDVVVISLGVQQGHMTVEVLDGDFVHGGFEDLAEALRALFSAEGTNADQFCNLGLALLARSERSTFTQVLPDFDGALQDVDLSILRIERPHPINATSGSTRDHIRNRGLDVA